MSDETILCVDPSSAAARAHIEAGRGSAFDPQVVDAFRASWMWVERGATPRRGPTAPRSMRVVTIN